MKNNNLLLELLYANKMNLPGAPSEAPNTELKFLSVTKVFVEDGAGAAPKPAMQ